MRNTAKFLLRHEQPNTVLSRPASGGWEAAQNLQIQAVPKPWCIANTAGGLHLRWAAQAFFLVEHSQFRAIGAARRFSQERAGFPLLRGRLAMDFFTAGCLRWGCLARRRARLSGWRVLCARGCCQQGRKAFAPCSPTCSSRRVVRLQGTRPVKRLACRGSGQAGDVLALSVRQR